MKHFAIALVLLSVSISVIAGCKPAHDPTKSYLTGYQNEKLLIQHDHKLYTAKCTDSWRGGPDSKDSTPDCSGLLTSVGLGQEIPEINHDSTSWIVTGGGAEYVPAGIGSDGSSPEYVVKFVSIKENGK